MTKKALSEKKKYDDGIVKLLTRIKDTCKVIVVGHTGQIDISGKSGFAKYIEHFKDQEKCAVCELTVNHRGWLSTHADALEEG